jgi:very-short-patch-repair endonuclease
MRIVYPLFLRSIQNAQSLRHQSTKAESILWRALRNRKLDGYKFRRQHPYKQFVFDFFCARHSLIIEIDGPIHLPNSRKERDKIRDERLQNDGFLILRFTNREIEDNLQEVLSTIKSEIQTRRALEKTK